MLKLSKQIPEVDPVDLTPMPSPVIQPYFIQVAQILTNLCMRLVIIMIIIVRIETGLSSEHLGFLGCVHLGRARELN